MFASLAESQTALVAALQHTPNSAITKPKSQVSVECFHCHQIGHFARNCPALRSNQKSQYRQPGFQQQHFPAGPQCTFCFGWGHVATACANNNNLIRDNRKLFPSLNFQGVPRYREAGTMSTPIFLLLVLLRTQLPPPHNSPFCFVTLRVCWCQLSLILVPCDP